MRRIGDGALLPPTADADGPYTGKAGAPVTFDGTNSSDPDGLTVCEGSPVDRISGDKAW